LYSESRTEGIRVTIGRVESEMQWKSMDLILVGEPERNSGDGEWCLVDGEVVDAPVVEEA